MLLKNHLQTEEVLNRICTWDEDEVPTQQIWSEVDTAIREKISRKLYYELASWEEQNGFFQNLRGFKYTLWAYGVRYVHQMRVGINR